MNSVVDTIMSHRSIRRFKDEIITNEQIKTIVEAAQMAPSSRFMQTYSIIGITNSQLKKDLGKVTGLAYVENNGHFLLFCADLHRLTIMASEEEKQNMKSMLESTQFYQIATIDASLAAQNAALAAESLELGVVYIGAIARNLPKIDKLLNLPSHVIPLFGMAIGFPDQKPEIKPRLPIQAVYFENQYNPDTYEQRELIESYDQKMKAYYEIRSENPRTDTWSGKNIEHFQKKADGDYSRYVKGKRMNLS
ncbi:oxygen-insensitive NADPH nitroreductase [Peribacillus sp. SI8-4]|uniref:oxygen-insensitive NADPH nitroreductase n=1 Tax=Peribacillus sp. SI8-4 TaxID=3048009 RepID=UPI002554AC99|nr:oxygen-insensitive NADPH nitroreductase [Peribacillus sp. SI8-4]